MFLSIYIHIPYCLKKCSYCDFVSYAKREEKEQEEYVDALCNEITNRKKEAEDSIIKSVFFGGGTPTLLNSDNLCRILNLIKSEFVISDDCEISVEANPETVSYQKMGKLKKAGVTRISLGVQSFDDVLLRNLGRVHDSLAVNTAIDSIKNAGFENFSLDLMFGLPGQSLDVWKKDLLQAVSHIPSHLSTYNLTLEESTKLDKQIKEEEMVLPDESTQTDMYKLGIEFLSKKGYEHYEISNFAMLGKRCQHNLMCWNYREYLGFGAGAHSFDGKQRRWNVSLPERYIMKVKKGIDPVCEQEVLSKQQLMNEVIMLGFRMMDGISISKFNQKFSIKFYSAYQTVLDNLIKQGLLNVSGDFIKLTNKGILFYNDVASSFFN